MSLHDLANHVQSAGRGEDKVLVHMTPGEVRGLQSIAMAHGGSLTINPETGLPEAGFLSSILPMLAGGALTVMSGGAINPLTAGFLVGGGTAAITGDLKKGLMAGLGAYGGAGLGAGLMQQGATGTMLGVDATAAGQMGAQVPTNMLATPAVAADDVALANLRSGLGGNIASVGPNIPTAGVGLNANALTGPQLNAMLPSTSTATAIPTAAPSLNAAITNVPPPAPVMGGPTTIAGSSGATAGFNQSMIPRYVPSDATTSQVLARGMQIAPQPSAALEVVNPPSTLSQLGRGVERSFTSAQGLKDLYAASEAAAPYGTVAGLGSTAMSYYDDKRKKLEDEMRARSGLNQGLIRPYEFDYGATNVAAQPYSGSAERTYFNPVFTAKPTYKAPGPEYAAQGGLMGYAVGGPIEEMAAMNAVGANTGYPMANLQTSLYANPMIQRPEATNVVAPSADAGVGAYSGEAKFAMGGMSSLGGYSDGGRLLKGPGDGVSDSIPASIGNRQPARLADGEFVVPARIVSELGNGSTDAGARKLYAMMDRVQNARKKSVGKKQVAVDSKAAKYLPA